MSILLANEEADFVFLKEKTKATSGNLSVQIEKLSTAGYITAIKETSQKPRTICKMTDQGRKAMLTYVSQLRTYFEGL